MTKEKEFIGPFERGAQVFAIAGALLLFWFFRYHEVHATGFFTSAFGPQEMLALYGPLLISLAPPFARMLTGRRSDGKLLDALYSAAMAFGAWWLLRTFPFDYSHFADPLPAGFHWLLAWVTDGFARIIFVIQIVAGIIGTISNFGQFLRGNRPVVES